MTATLPVEDRVADARDVSTLTWLLSLVHDDPDAAARIRALGDELEQIHVDQHMAWRMCPETTREWLDELRAKERATRKQLRQAAGLP